MIQAMLDARNLPALTDRNVMLDLLQHEEYGYLPPLPDTLEWTEEESAPVCDGAATLTKLTMRGTVCGRPFSFPFYRAMPDKGNDLPFFVFIN